MLLHNYQLGGMMSQVIEVAAWPSGKARVCKILTPGSNPGAALSNSAKN
jgi:hypothetical protein